MLAILYVGLPAFMSVVKLKPAEQTTYLKAFVKTPKVQRLGLLLFWIYAVRFLCESARSADLIGGSKSHFDSLKLFSHDWQLPNSISNSLLYGLEEFALLTFLFSPVIIYASVCLVSIVVRSFLRKTRQDPDLVVQRRRWTGLTQTLLMSGFVASILSITLNVNGPAYMLSNWLLASARDANMFCGSWEYDYLKDVAKLLKQGHRNEAIAELSRRFDSDGAEKKLINIERDLQTVSNQPREDFFAFPGTLSNPAEYDPAFPTLQGVYPNSGDLSFIRPFDTFIISSTSIALFLLLLQPAIKLNALLSSFCWRVVSPFSMQNYIEAFLESLRLPSRNLNFGEAHPFWTNALRTFFWLLTCYAVLFWIFGFCGGPLGITIQNWMMASVADASYVDTSAAPDWLFDPKVRIFLGAIAALYGTAPIAITAAVFLPYAEPRRIVLNCDGLLFSQGPFLCLWGRQFRLWSDLKSITARKIGQKKGRQKIEFNLKFWSGGSLNFNNSQISSKDLRVLMESIDQYAASCEVDPEAVSICQNLAEDDLENASSDGKTESSIANLSVEQFKSTIFNPYKTGDILPGTQIRIIKLMASKPLCAVYLGRSQDGRLVVIKQFFLAEKNDETSAMEKILRREYELLGRLENPGIAKVLDTFSIDNSTYLIIEHRAGTDLRAVVQEHGARSEALTKDWAKQICEIMIYLHGLAPPVLHRDLTPDNIVAGEDGQLRLIDFGAAREFLDGITGTMIGKHGYIAPEQLRGQATQKSDIYSFGCTLYFLLTGNDPLALCQSSPGKNVDCAIELDELIQNCTEFDEEKRPQSFVEILNRLNNMNKGFRINIKVKEKEPIA